MVRTGLVFRWVPDSFPPMTTRWVMVRDVLVGHPLPAGGGPWRSTNRTKARGGPLGSELSPSGSDVMRNGWACLAEQ